MRYSHMVLDGLSKQAYNKNYQFNRIYRILCNPNMYVKAYSNFYSSICNNNRIAVDKIDDETLRRITRKLKNESYQAKHVRCTRPVSNGTTVHMNGSQLDDRLIQEVCRMILEAIYEPVFYPNSHGLRPNKNCHTALEQVCNFKNADWFIECSIKDCFSNLDHQLLISFLRKRINDERFTRLIWKLLKAGCLEDFEYGNTYSGTLRGGVLSSILANIYMHEFDTYVLETIQGIITCHANYSSLRYVRYANDFIIGVCGSKSDCRTVIQLMKDFLINTLNLELPEKKWTIVHNTDKVRFINYEIQAREINLFAGDVSSLEKQGANRELVLLMPKDIMLEYIVKKDIVQDINAKQWRSKARACLQNLTPLEIVTAYNTEIAGLYNYYAVAENVAARMNMVYHMMEYSCLKTLAAKYKISVSQVRAKLQIGSNWGIRKEKGEAVFFYNKGFAKKTDTKSNVDYAVDSIPY